MAMNLEAMVDDFDTRRRIVEALDIQAILTVEDGQKVVRASCILGKNLSALHPIPFLVCDTTHKLADLTLTARIVLSGTPGRHKSETQMASTEL